jgi:hypothetical protein
MLYSMTFTILVYTILPRYLAYSLSLKGYKYILTLAQALHIGLLNNIIITPLAILTTLLIVE